MHLKCSLRKISKNIARICKLLKGQHAKNRRINIYRCIPLFSWGGHIEIAAMRELYNVNVEIFHRGAVLEPRPIGIVFVS